jgi:hypothetical protein
LSQNPNITIKHVTAHPDLPWDWSFLCANPNLTFDGILWMETHGKPWDSMTVSNNAFKHDQTLQKLHIIKMRKLRQRMKMFTLPRWYKLHLLTKTKAFCEWYYDPQNIGGKICKKRIANLF